MKRLRAFIPALLLIVLTACGNIQQDSQPRNHTNAAESAADISIQDVPQYSGEPYVEINNNQPDFDEDELTAQSYETYSDLDSLGRCGPAEASIGRDLMPTEERGKIGMIKPSGWHTVKYDNVDGKYLYNRCHLIGYQLTAENANEKNLITGTRYFNVEGMLPFENEVADYIKETDNNVMYRVTPIFEGDNLEASGVQMEAKSVEDDGEGVSYNVYVYNVQPGITIDYRTGESKLSGDGIIESDKADKTGDLYIINKNTHKFHKPDCQSTNDTKAKNKKEFQGDRDELIDQGYDPCKRCNP